MIRLLVVLLFSGLLFLTIFKAATVSLVYDESITYYDIVSADYEEIYTYEKPTANNHLLNSILMKETEEYFGLSQFSLRLPNVLAHLIYLLFSLLLVKDYKKYLSLACFILLNLNPFLLDFFALARGYGLALGFMMMSLFFLKKAIFQKENYLYSLALVISATLAVLANFSFLTYFISLISIYTVWVFITPWPLWKKASKVAVVGLPSVLLAWYTIPIGLKLKEANELYFGGETGFWADTVVSLIKCSIYGSTYLPYSLLICQILVGTALLIGLILCFSPVAKIQAFKLNYPNDKFVIVIFAILLLSSLGTVAQHYIAGTKYLIERTAIYFIPLFTLFVCEALRQLTKPNRPSYFTIGLASVIVLHFISSYSLRSFYIWKDKSKEAMLEINRHVQLSKKRSDIVIQGMGFYVPTMQLYRKMNDYQWINRIDYFDSSKVNAADYLYIDWALYGKVSKTDFQEVKHYPSAGSYLLKRRGL